MSENDQLIERTNAGLARARADGTKLGRRTSLSKQQQLEVLDGLKDGVSVVRLAKAYATSRQTIMRIREKGKEG